jgi:hypothetical protein
MCSQTLRGRTECQRKELPNSDFRGHGKSPLIMDLINSCEYSVSVSILIESGNYAYLPNNHVCTGRYRTTVPVPTVYTFLQIHERLCKLMHPVRYLATIWGRQWTHTVKSSIPVWQCPAFYESAYQEIENNSLPDKKKYFFQVWMTKCRGWSLSWPPPTSLLSNSGMVEVKLESGKKCRSLNIVPPYKCYPI